MRTAVILHNIRSVYNVGSIFRTCDAVGVDEVVLCGYTPQPLDRFGSVRSDLAKVALGAEKSVRWRYVEDVRDVIVQLEQEGFQVIALEQAGNAVDYKSVEKNERIALLLGNEPDGIEKEVLEVCDVVAEIPMRGAKESLNVSVAAGVALFRIFDI